MYILLIYPNSASCERGFSTLDWLIRKRRQNLNVEKLELMTKLITYYKSNVPKELVFYRKKITESEIMKTVQLALAEPIDDNYDDTIESITERTISGEVIPENNVRVIIKLLWLENTLNLKHQAIIESLGEISSDDFEFIDENEFLSDNENEENLSNNFKYDRLDFITEELIAKFSEFN